MVSAIRARTYKRNEAGVALMEAGELEEALGAFTDCITTNPSFPPAFFNRAMVNNLLDRHRDALRDILEFQKLTGGTAFGYNLAGSIMSQLKHYSDAVTAFSQAIEIVPLPGFFYRRGVALCSMGEYAQGYEDLVEAAKMGAEEARELLSRMAEDTKNQKAAAAAAGSL